MKQSDKIRVAVLFGGRSAEHEVSLRSAENVIQHLDRNLFEVVPIGIDKQGSWFLGNDVFAKSLAHNQVDQLQQNNQTWFTPEWIQTSVEASSKHHLSVSHDQSHFDVVFPAVHGTFCEDGKLQGLLEVANVPYVGCGVLASAIGMDKDVSKRLVSGAGVPVAPYLSVKQKDWQHAPQKILGLINTQLTYPLFVKPANTGSSIGISKVKTPDQLADAMTEAFRFDTKILVENGLNVLELELAVLESLTAGEEPMVSVVGEIKPRHEFYSYEAKYVDDQGAELLIPASVSKEVCEAAQQMAKTIFLALECEGMARIDLFYDKDSKKLYFNELNTIPGFTQISMYPKLMSASGMTYSALLTHLVKLALARHHEKRSIIHSYLEETA